jgi:hypothetical protein
MNLNEASDEQLQQTLQSMPKGKALMKELVRLTEASRHNPHSSHWHPAGLRCILVQS